MDTKTGEIKQTMNLNKIRQELADRELVRQRGFMQGFSVAIGIIQNGFGETGLAKMVCEEGGFTLESFYKNGIDPADMATLKHIFKKG